MGLCVAGEAAGSRALAASSARAVGQGDGEETH